MTPINRKRKGGRRGSAAVEAAVLAPLVITAMFGMMEVGYSFMVRQTVTLAAREGARAAVLPGSTHQHAQSAADAAMSAASLEGYTVTSNVDSLGPSDTEVWVTVSIPFNRASFTGQLLGGNMFDISATCAMRREGVTVPDGAGGGIIPD